MALFHVAAEGLQLPVPAAAGNDPRAVVPPADATAPREASSLSEGTESAIAPDDALLDAWPGVRIDADNAAYYAGLLEHRLLINRCDDCGRWHHPPRSICSRCWSTAVAAREVTGRGRIALYTILRQGPRRGGADYERGHPLVAVDLEEQPGLRVSGTVVDLAPEAVTEGLAVELVWPGGGAPPDLLHFRAVDR